MTISIRRTLALPLAALAAAALLSCTGVGDGGVGASNEQLSRGASYSSASGPAAGQPQVYLVKDSGTRTSVCLGVESWYAVDLYSVAFTLQYDPTVLSYTGYELGSLLGSSSDLLAQVTPQPPTAPDSLVVGVTRNNAVTTVGVTGNGRLITLCFDLVGPATSSPVTFTGTNVLGFNSSGSDPANPANIAIPRANFVNGTVTVE